MDPELRDEPARRGVGLRLALAASLILGVLSALSGSPVQGAEWLVESGAPSELGQTIAKASSGDRVVVVGGVHRGPLVIDKTLDLVGRDWPVVEGDGKGTVIAIGAPGVRFSGFVVRGSGASLDEENSGIAVDEGSGTEIVGNRFEDVLFGIYLRKSPRSVIAGNKIRSKPLEVPRRGDAIRVWSSNGTRIEENNVRGSRDVVLWYSSDLTVRGNTVAGGRYGLHFMYCDDAAIEGNLLRGNSVGAFLMYSRRLHLVRNSILENHGPSGFGVGLKDMDDAVVESNRFVGNRVGVFLDNSPREAASSIEVRDNSIAGNDIGVSLLPNVRRGVFEGNSFVENQQQIEIAGSGGDPDANAWKANFWSDYAGYDADLDGFGDSEYRADRLFEDLSDRRPGLRLFLYSPAKDALEFAARTMPLIRPRPRIVDHEPRMSPKEPDGCPTWETPGRGLFGPLGGGLLAMAGAILLTPGALRRLSSRRGGRQVSEPSGSEAPKGGAPEILIRAQKVSKLFGSHRALDDVSFEIREGESVAVWGPNGAGKTTLLRVLLGVVPFSGEVTVAGADPWREGKDVRSRIGFVPQDVALQGEMRLDETVEFFAALRRASLEGVGDLLESLGLGAEYGKRVRELSGGQRQRLAVALALLSDPPILLLDEPTANLDARARADFIALLRELKATGRTLVFSSHRPEEVQAVADRVLHLDAGRLVADDAPSLVALSGRRMAEVWLRFDADELGRAAQELESSGYSLRRLGDHVVVEVEAGRKLEPIRALLTRGIEIESFEVDTAEERRANGDA